MENTAPKLRETSRSLPIALLRARETIMVPFREMLAKSGISEQKWRVLRVVSETGPMEQTAIATAASLLLPSLTRILTAMEKDGLLIRTPDATDRRKSIVALTDAGFQLIADHAGESTEIFDLLETRFGTENLDQLLSLLEMLHDTDMSRDT